LLRDYKSNTARLIIWQFQMQRNQEALEHLAKAVKRPGKQKFKIWEDGYLAKEIFNPEFMKQKMDYIHNNPLQPHWQLAESVVDYVWSSARWYLQGEPVLIPLSSLEGWFFSY